MLNPLSRASWRISRSRRTNVSYLPLVQAGIGALGSRAGGVGPHINPYNPSRKGAREYEKAGLKDVRAYRRGGINDPDLEYLGFGPGWKTLKAATLRDETAGEARASEERLGGVFREYGGATEDSGRYIENL